MRLEASGLGYAYGDYTVFSDLDFHVDTGETVTVLGPNGTGKTTLIRTLCGVMPPRTGTVRLDGVPLDDIEPRELAKSIGYIPQNQSSMGYTSVFNSVLIGRRPYAQLNYSRTDVEETARAMEVMGVTDLADRRITNISGGQRQKVQIARAIAQNPRIYFMDEPTSALDLHNQTHTMKIMNRLKEERGVGVVIALHDLNLALRYSDRIVVMKDGHVYSEGEPLEVITPRMISDVYGMKAEICENEHGHFVFLIDEEEDAHE